MSKNNPVVFQTNRGVRISIDPRYSDPRNTSMFNEVMVRNQKHDTGVIPLAVEQIDFYRHR